MGFPIQKSTDQRVLAPPRGLSQRATSFIASLRQGIRRMPLSRLIDLLMFMHGENCAAKLAPRSDHLVRECLSLDDVFKSILRLKRRRFRARTNPLFTMSINAKRRSAGELVL